MYDVSSLYSNFKHGTFSKTIGWILLPKKLTHLFGYVLLSYICLSRVRVMSLAKNR